MSAEIVIACYRPRPGQAAELRELVARHVGLLRERGLATDRPVQRMEAGDGTVVEVFEWVSAQAASDAHSDPVVREVWDAMGAVAEFVPLSALPGADRPFVHFRPID